MQKKKNLLLGLLALAPLLLVVLVWPDRDSVTPRVQAAPRESAFSNPFNITYPSDYENTQKPRLAIAADNYLHVVWMEGVPATDNGPVYVRGQETTWPAWQWIAWHNNDGYTNPVIALDSTGTAHVVWAASPTGESPYDIWYSYKPSSGTWSPAENLSNEGYNTVYPSIAIDSQDRIWVAWQSTVTELNNDVFVRSKPAGGNWGSVTNVSNHPAEDQNPSITVDSNAVPHLVWRSTQPGNWDILYSRYQGAAWTSAENISASSLGSHYPRVGADSGGKIYVVWEEEMGSEIFQIALRRRDSGGWYAAQLVSTPGVKSLYPATSTDRQGDYYVVWQDYRHGGSNLETYFSHSTDSGVTWLGDENVSRNGTTSQFPDVVAQSGGYAHIVWQDMAPGQLDIYYSKATVQVPPPPTVVPPTNTPSPTPPPLPHGYVNMIAQDPPNNEQYTRLLTLTLELSATSDVGATITDMRVCNLGEPLGTCPWVPFATSIANWPLLDNGYDCGYKWVYAWFRDEFNRQSLTYTDYIVYDSFLTASMSLNEDNAYTNRLTVTVNTVDLDGQILDCTGLKEMRLKEDWMLTYTAWLAFTLEQPYTLAPGMPTHTVFVQYRDYAYNLGTLSDTIAVDVTPPYSGTPPVLISATTHLTVEVSGLQAYDIESGVAHVWMANRPTGPWKVLPYCGSPPCSYTWNLGYGGPPAQAPYTHTIYVKYEDASGYGPYPGNFTPVYTGTILIRDISNIYLPILPKLDSQLYDALPAAAMTPSTIQQVGGRLGQAVALIRHA